MSGSSGDELHSTISPKMNHVAERAPQGWQTEHELSADSDHTALGFTPLSDSEEVGPTARAKERMGTAAGRSLRG
jgi:hypothetical protein